MARKKVKVNLKSRRYKAAWSKGYQAGMKRLEKKGVSGVISAAMNTHYVKDDVQRFSKENDLKWQGFSEAMNLIIASKQ